MMICNEHGLFEVDIKKSLNFRKYCSELGSKPNRSPFYYTSLEEKTKKALDKLKIVYFHNVGIELEGHKYYLDFYLPLYNTVIGVNPSIWHKIGDRDKSDKIKYELLEQYGFNILLLEDEELKLSITKLADYIIKSITEKSFEIPIHHKDE